MDMRIELLSQFLTFLGDTLGGWMKIVRALTFVVLHFRVGPRMALPSDRVLGISLILVWFRIGRLQLGSESDRAVTWYPSNWSS